MDPLYLKTEELVEANIVTELKDNEILSNMEHGINNINADEITSKSKIEILNAQNYDNNYSSEDENLVTLNMNNSNVLVKNDIIFRQTTY